MRKTPETGADFLELIGFDSEEVRDRLVEIYYEDDVNRLGMLTMLQAIYQNGHKVVGVRIGSSRTADRKKALFVTAINLNGKRVMYRVFYCQDEQNRQTCVLGEQISKGWQQVAVW